MSAQPALAPARIDNGAHPEGTGPLKVLWLSKGLGRGGAERLIVDSAHLIDRSRFDVHVAYLLPHKDLFVDEIRPAVSNVVCLARGTRDPAWPLRLRRYLDEHQIDVVHSHSPLPGAFARVISGHGRLLVHTEHNMWDRYHWATRLANAATFPKNRAVIAVSEGVAASIHRRCLRGGVEPEVVIHGTSSRRVHRGPAARLRARELLGLDPTTFVAGSVGNFTPKKDHANMLEAFAAVRRTLPGARLVLIGSGPLEADLRRRAGLPDLAGSVDFTGTRDDVEVLLAGLDVFVMSSRYEGLPIALLEAMSSGVPPVATRVGGIPEVVLDGESGRLVEPGDPGALATAILQLAADPAERERLGESAIHASSSCDLESAVRSLEALYERVAQP
jgi:glycosyltransferase involved in cell wall biosynthesis